MGSSKTTTHWTRALSESRTPINSSRGQSSIVHSYFLVKFSFSSPQTLITMPAAAPPEKRSSEDTLAGAKKTKKDEEEDVDAGEEEHPCPDPITLVNDLTT